MAVQRIGNLPPAEQMPGVRLRGAQQRIAAASVQQASDIKTTNSAIATVDAKIPAGLDFIITDHETRIGNLETP